MKKNNITKAIIFAFCFGLSVLGNAKVTQNEKTKLDYEDHLVSVYKALIEQKNKVIGFEIVDESITTKQKEIKT